MLAERVAAGELPPVAERLPVNPLVVEPYERIGQYGGTWRTVLLGGGDNMHLARTVSYEGLLRFTPAWDGVIPNVAESFEVNEDATEITFHLRQGIRWSDGHPFTAADIMFWYEDVVMNRELTPAVPGWFTAGPERTPGTVEKIDDYTVVFRFTHPNGFFVMEMAGLPGVLPVSYPRHYLEQFHIRHNPEGIAALMAEAGVTTWVALFEVKGGHPGGWHINHWQNPARPMLNPWIPLTPYAGTRVTFERNPFFWKVDPEGNQLPYIDRVVFDIVESRDVIVLRVMNGEIDFLDRHIGDVALRPALFDHKERGDYRFIAVPPETMNTLVLPFNQTHRDPVKREIFQNRDFRVALSHAINRQEIIDLIFVGMGEPWQVAPQRETPFFHERLATQYLEYDPDLANEILDRHYPARDAEGFRLGPDGQRITVIAEAFADGHLHSHVDILELVQAHWRAVGIEMLIRPMDRTLLWQRIEANDHDMSVWPGSGGGMEALIRPRYYMPFELASAQAPAWAAWFLNPALAIAEEAPEPERRQWELYNQLRAEADLARQAELMWEILEIAADRFHSIGISSVPIGVAIARNDLRNVASVIPSTGGWYPNPAPVNPFTWFFDR
jgi:peptide/nickel transport system substrate-binding protein